MKFNTPPDWPQPPAGWTPPPGWTPDPSWPAAPEGWQFWLEDEKPTTGHEPASPRSSARDGAARQKSSWKERSRRTATASSGLWSRATASSQRHWIFGGVGLGTGLLTGVLITAAAGTSSGTSGSGGSWLGSGPTPIETAVETCDLTDSAGISVGDAGQSLTVQTTGAENSYGADVTDLACVLAELDASDSVMARMDSTRALDGRQTGTWDVFEASWGYHPDDGVNLVIEEVE